MTPWMIYDARPWAFPALSSCGMAASEPHVPQHPSLQGELTQLPPPEPCPIAVQHATQEPGRGGLGVNSGAMPAQQGAGRCAAWAPHRANGAGLTPEMVVVPLLWLSPDPWMLLCWSTSQEFLKACEHGKDVCSDWHSLLFISHVDKDLFFSI